ncbi:hypothetical protein KR222_009727 [Zaprionus bogoriensis]|nr:hypothetical protein KR222_009727 [Zaprionus bogoriensis]
MESINENIDHQFDQHLVDETGEFLGHQARAPDIDGNCENGEVGISYVAQTDTVQNAASPTVLSEDLETLIATTTDDSRMHGNAESSSVVMVIDSMGHSSQTIQTTYQIVPQQMHLPSGRTLPLSLLPLQHTRHAHERLAGESPVDFVGSDISLDCLTVSTSSQIVAVKQEQKVLIVHTEDAENDVRTGERNRNNMQSQHSPHIDLSISDINVGAIDDLSSDGGVEEVTLNQHHQQLLEEHRHHHQQYSHRLITTSHITNREQQQQQRAIQLEMGHHRDALSVIVQTDEDDIDDVEDEHDPAHDRDHDGNLLSPSLEHSTYQTLTSVNNRISPSGFSPTSYATLTPIQPLPPISTMSDKFAYAGGHITGSVNSSTNGRVVTSTNRIINCVNESSAAESTNNNCTSFPSLPNIPHPSVCSLGSLSLSGLGSGTQSPYSSYDKLPSIISPPPHNYVSSPSHGLSGMVGSCEMHANSSSVPSPIPGIVSPPHSHSPPLQVNVNINLHTPNADRRGNGHATHNQQHGNGCQCEQEKGRQIHSHVHGQVHGHIQDIQVQQHVQKRVICLSPPNCITDGAVGCDFDASYGTHQHDHELFISTSSSTNSTEKRSSLRLQQSPTLSAHSAISAVSACSVVSMPLHSPTSVVKLPHMNGSIANLSIDLPVVVSLTPTPPPGHEGAIAIGNGGGIVHRDKQEHQMVQTNIKVHSDELDLHRSSLNICDISQQQNLANGFLDETAQVQNKLPTHSAKSVPVTTSSSVAATANRLNSNDIEEINTKELAQRISAELKRYSIPQAIFAQRVLCRSQGTLSDLLRNPKPWSKLKSGRETFRRMFKWLQEPEFQRMSALRMAAAQIPQRPTSSVAVTTGGSAAVSATATATAGAGISGLSLGATSTLSTSPVVIIGSIVDETHVSTLTGNGNGSCRRKEEPHIEQMPQPKKPRLVFTDLQRRTLQAIFKETKRPSKEMQVTIARQLGLEPTTVGNFFMNARRRSMDKWRDDDTKNQVQHMSSRNSLQSSSMQQEESEEMDLELEESNNREEEQTHYTGLHTTAMSPLGNFDDEADMDHLALEHHEFLVDDHEAVEHDML